MSLENNIHLVPPMRKCPKDLKEENKKYAGDKIFALNKPSQPH